MLRRIAATAGIVAAVAAGAIAPVAAQATPAPAAQASVQSVKEVVTGKNLEAFLKKSEKDVVFLAFSSTRNFRQYDQLARRVQGRYEVGLTTLTFKDVAEYFEVTSQPVTLVIRDQEVVDEYYGMSTLSDYNGFVDYAIEKWGKKKDA